jgi:hypothetical protein
MINLRPVFRRAQLLSAVIVIATALILPTAVPTHAQGILGARPVVSGLRTGFIGRSLTGLIDSSLARPAPALSVILEAPAKPFPITPYVSPQPVLPSRSAGALMIQNEGNRDLHFQLRPEGGQLKPSAMFRPPSWP